MNIKMNLDQHLNVGKFHKQKHFLIVFICLYLFICNDFMDYFFM